MRLWWELNQDTNLFKGIELELSAHNGMFIVHAGYTGLMVTKSRWPS